MLLKALSLVVCWRNRGPSCAFFPACHAMPRRGRALSLYSEFSQLYLGRLPARGRPGGFSAGEHSPQERETQRGLEGGLRVVGGTGVAALDVLVVPDPMPRRFQRRR